ncbi:MAG TPA: hypothetical protein ENN30_00775 [Candidatus Woesearchaeota archaeon]|nr:hypothetical protein [Candidatus Woesearchaeota archaeon]
MALFKDSTKITVRMFFKVMGWPKEVLNDHLKKAVEALKQAECTVIREDYSEPELEGEKLYTSHVEVDVEASDLSKLFQFCLVFPPLVIEVLNPPELYITAGELQDILADTLAKVRDDQQNIRLLDTQISNFKNAIERAKKTREAPKTETRVILGGEENPENKS